MARTHLPRGLLLSVMRQKVGPQKTSTTSAERTSKGAHPLGHPPPVRRFAEKSPIFERRATLRPRASATADTTRDTVSCGTSATADTAGLRRGQAPMPASCTSTTAFSPARPTKRPVGAVFSCVASRCRSALEPGLTGEKRRPCAHPPEALRAWAQRPATLRVATLPRLFRPRSSLCEPTPPPGGRPQRSLRSLAPLRWRQPKNCSARRSQAARLGRDLPMTADATPGGRPQRSLHSLAPLRWRRPFPNCLHSTTISAQWPLSARLGNSSVSTLR